MSSLFHMVLIALASNLENLGVGIAYGIRRIKVPALSNLIMAGIAFSFTYVTVWAGAYTRTFLADSVAAAMGAVLLICVGIWVMVAQAKESDQADPLPGDRAPSVIELVEEPVKADADKSGTISPQEALILGVAVAIDCFANGFSAGLWKLAAFPTAALTAAVSYLALWGGSWLGARYAATWFGGKANLVAGFILIMLGLYQLL